MITRTWRAVDACNNQSDTRSQTITLRDTQSPEIGNAGDNTTIECTATPSFTPPTASDACSTYTVVQIGSDVTGGNSCAKTTTRTWLAVDACGNSSGTRAQTITQADRQAPAVGNAGNNVTIECTASPSFTPPTASDACNTYTVVQVGSDVTGGNSCAKTTTRTWLAYDACGNSSITRSQTITQVDTRPPAIGNAGPNVSIECTLVPPFTAPTASDACNTYTVVAVGNDVTTGTSNSRNITRTWLAVDACGNSSTTRSQTITLYDIQPPTITGVSATPSILWPPNHQMRDVTINYTSADNCGVVSCVLTVTSNQPVNGTGDGDTDPDWIIVDDHHVKLRAERANHSEARIYTITITCTDAFGNSTSQSTTVTIAHNITDPISGNSFRVGSTVNFAGVFWDRPGNKHTGNWLIDDNTTVKGTVTEPQGNKNGKLTGSYKFTTTGVYKLQMNILDQNKNLSYANTNEDLEAIVVIYDPNGGNTYGGGYFNSQAGALTGNPTAEGKASYGFAINYFKTATYPKGETQFKLDVGDFEFNALNFDYLVINGATAQFRGTGKVTGDQSGYGFIMTVIDGDLNGTGVDKVRMKIFNKNTNEIIYDNMPGASDASLPTANVGLNSHVVISGTGNNLKAITANELGEAPATLQVIAHPNPSNTNFTIRVKSNNSLDVINIQVVDMFGRVIERKVVNTNQTIQIGDQYRPGTYIVKIIQGFQQEQLKLVKLPQ